ncbi:MAG: hypothetical protein ACD_19C00431G0002 [uncultured bacterium]|nr:MAG: hypothetical protein ACD_19C00431G0002 [uncultured bacterium]
MNPNISYINRDIESKIKNSLNQGKVIVVYGARQVGKTTLLKNIFEKLDIPYLYLSCEEQRVKTKLVPDYLELKKMIGDYKYIILDEAQNLENPGLILKILIDNNPSLNIIASGSSSFDLANKISEPLTGRHFKFMLYPFSYNEIKKNVLGIDMDFTWRESLLFGAYPKIFTTENNTEKIDLLSLLSSDYLYKDILTYGLVKNNQKIHDLLVALALQLGNEVSYNELSILLSIDYKTVERYIDLLEKSFVIFRLRGLSRNLREELKGKVKIYFYDLGIRNSLLNNFTELKLRMDVGSLFENYFVLEKIKSYQKGTRVPNIYFWRTYTQKEIDFIEEVDGKFKAYEIKYSSKKTISKATKEEFMKSYPTESIKVISSDNLGEEI